jgi:hypothetical protein
VPPLDGITITTIIITIIITTFITTFINNNRSLQ